MLLDGSVAVGPWPDQCATLATSNIYSFQNILSKFWCKQNYIRLISFIRIILWIIIDKEIEELMRLNYENFQFLKIWVLTDIISNGKSDNETNT